MGIKHHVDAQELICWCKTIVEFRLRPRHGCARRARQMRFKLAWLSLAGAKGIALNLRHVLAGSANCTSSKQQNELRRDIHQILLP